MKKIHLLLLLAAVCLLLCACRQQPPEALRTDTLPGAPEIAALPGEDSALQLGAVLYFPYGDTGLLRSETRQIEMLPNVTREMALVRALLDGPREGGGAPLFPEKTEVLSTQAQDGVIYITLNESLYDRYAEEGALTEAGVLRRRLALTALAATLTESGEYRGVQVLVRPENNVGSSMRLTGRFWGQADTPLPLLTRQSDALPTPSAYARELLAAWQQRSVEALLPFLSARESQGLSALEQHMAAAPALLTFAVYDGTVSPGGESAVVCADLVLRDVQGGETVLDSYPLSLVREGGAWKMQQSRLLSMMGENNE